MQPPVKCSNYLMLFNNSNESHKTSHIAYPKQLSLLLEFHVVGTNITACVLRWSSIA